MIDRARSHSRQFAFAFAVAALLAGCMTRAPAPVIEREPFPALRPAPPPPGVLARAPEVPPTYTIKRGDTLYQIALDHGLDYRELAAWNNIENVNVIRVGQVLALAAPGTATEGGAVTAPLITGAGARVMHPASNAATANATANGRDCERARSIMRVREAAARILPHRTSAHGCRPAPFR